MNNINLLDIHYWCPPADFQQLQSFWRTNIRWIKEILSIEHFFSFPNIGKHFFLEAIRNIDKSIHAIKTARFVRFAGVMSYKVLMRISNASRKPTIYGRSSRWRLQTWTVRRGFRRFNFWSSTNWQIYIFGVVHHARDVSMKNKQVFRNDYLLVGEDSAQYHENSTVVP